MGQIGKIGEIGKIGRFGSTGKMRRPVLLLSLLVWIGALLQARAEPIAPSEYQVKAAFIYHFAKFVDWPAEPLALHQPFVIGILGRDPFDGFIDEVVSGKSVRDRPIIVKRFSKIEEASGCQILFVSSSEGEGVVRLLKQLDRAPILTVSDIDRFAELGGMVQLVMDENRVRFAINLAAVERTGLKPSSQLLKLARIVPHGGENKRGPSSDAYSRLTEDYPWRVLYGMALERPPAGETPSSSPPVQERL